MAGFDVDEEYLEQLQREDPELAEAIRQSLQDSILEEELFDPSSNAFSDPNEVECEDVCVGVGVGVGVEDEEFLEALRLSELDVAGRNVDLSRDWDLRDEIEEMIFITGEVFKSLLSIEGRLDNEKKAYIYETSSSLELFLRKFPETFEVGYDGFVSLKPRAVPDVTSHNATVSRQLSASSETISKTVLRRMPNCEEIVRDSLFGFNFCLEVGAITRDEKEILKDQLLRGKVYDPDIVQKLPDFFQATLVEEVNSRYRLGECVIGRCDEEVVKLKRYSSVCEHDEQMCQDCIVKTIEADFHRCEKPNEIKCPSCRVPISSVEVLRHVKNYPEVKERAEAFYLNCELRLLNFKRCAKEGCRGGGLLEVHQSYFNCIVCQSATCSSCDLFWHEGLTCSEYAALNRAKEEKMDAATQQLIEETVRACPKCRRPDLSKHPDDCELMMCCAYGYHKCLHNIKDYGKCDHGGVRDGLPFCGTRFCWLCCGIVDPDGTRHHVNGIRGCTFPNT